MIAAAFHPHDPLVLMDEDLDDVEWLDLRAAFSAPPEPLDFVLPGIVAGTVAALVAPGAAGKSMLALQAAVTIASGPDLLGLSRAGGWKPTTGRVVYMAAEDISQALCLRSHAIGLHLAPAQREAVAERLHIAPLVGRCVDIMSAYWRDWIAQQADGARLLILDTLRRFHAAEETDGGAMAKLIGVMESVCRDTGTTILFLHHASKAATLGGGGGLQQASRGSSVLVDNIRGQLNLVGMTDKEAQDFGIDADCRDRFVRLVVAKPNYCARPPDIWLRKHEGGVLLPAALELKRERRKARPVEERAKERRKSEPVEDEGQTTTARAAGGIYGRWW